VENSSYLVRLCTPNDAKTVAQHAHFSEKSTDADRENYATWVSGAIERGIYVGCFAIAETKVIAGAGLLFLEMGPVRGDTNPLRARFSNVFTDDAYRGYGVATALCERLFVVANERGVRSFSLAATGLSRSMYERYGFVPYPGEMRLTR
jgi:GNAT superfamily N-acetyltransferase